MSSGLCTFRQRGEWFVVGFNTDRLTDPVVLKTVGHEIGEQFRRLPLRAQAVITFEGVEHSSSAALGLLTSLRAIVVDDRLGELALCRVNSQLREILHLTRLEKQFAIHERLRDVVAVANMLPAGGRRTVAAVATAPRGARETQWID